MKPYHALIAAGVFLVLLALSVVFTVMTRAESLERKQAIAHVLDAGDRRLKEKIDRNAVAQGPAAEAAAALEQARRRLDSDGDFSPASLRVAADHLDAGEEQLGKLADSLAAANNKYQIAISSVVVCFAGFVLSGVLGIVRRRKKTEPLHFTLSQEGSEYLAHAKHEAPASSEQKAGEFLSDLEKK